MELYDPFRFHLIQFLDFDEIVKLARTNQKYATMLHDPDLYVHLLERDYGVTQPVETPEMVYRKLKMVNVLTRFVKDYRGWTPTCTQFQDPLVTISDDSARTLGDENFNFEAFNVTFLVFFNSNQCKNKLASLITEKFGYEVTKYWGRTLTVHMIGF